jgi:hypothetical protein
VHVVEAMLNHRSGTVSGVAAIYNRYTHLQEIRMAARRYETFDASLVAAPGVRVVTAPDGIDAPRWVFLGPQKRTAKWSIARGAAKVDRRTAQHPSAPDRDVA